MKKIKQWFCDLLGLRYKVHKLKDRNVTLFSDGWVVIGDELSTDALPITLCSQELIEQFEKEMEEAGV